MLKGTEKVRLAVEGAARLPAQIGRLPAVAARRPVASELPIAVHYLVGPKRGHSDRTAIGVCELDHICGRRAIEDMNDGSHRPGRQPFSRNGFSELNHVVRLQRVTLPSAGTEFVPGNPAK